MKRLVGLALCLTACSSAPTLDAGSVDAAGQADDAGADDAGADDAGADDAGADAGPPRDSVAVLSLNLQCLSLDGTRFATNAERFDAIARAVAVERVDVLLLQEVCDDGSVDAVTLLQRALEAAGAGTFAAHVVYGHIGWEGTPEEARESVAVLARTLTETTALVHRDQAGLRRVAASASADTSLGSLRVVSVHLAFRDAPVRRSQAREAAAVALSESDPSLAVLVGGDLNARARSDPYLAFSALGYVDASAGAGGSRIDHLFVHRGAPLAVAEARRLFVTERVSDHPGVLVRLVRGPPEVVEITRIVAEHDPGTARTLWLRGDAAPLTWAVGWPMHDLGDGRWRFVSTELTGPLEVKALIDDVTWQTGPNERVVAGTDFRFAPSF